MRRPKGTAVILLTACYVTTAFVPVPRVLSREHERRKSAVGPLTLSSSKDIESHIAMIKSYNLAGMVSANDDSENEEIVIDFGAEPGLIAVTGETGSGKSLLISKVADLVTGGKATPSMLSPSPGGKESKGSQATVEMVMKLSEPHLSMVEEASRKVGIKQQGIKKQNGLGTLVIRRTLTLQQGPNGSSKSRLKSSCEINGHSVTLKTIRAVAAPLLTIVDAAAAAAALSRPNSRMSAIDTGVPLPIKSAVLEAKVSYRQARLYREELEMEVNNRVLPSSYSPDGDEESFVLLQHWVDELDAFEERMNSFRDSAVSSRANLNVGGSPVDAAVQLFGASSWFDLSLDDKIPSRNLMASAPGAVSSFYSALLDFRQALKQLTNQLEAARAACETLSSLSSPDSAVTALERARNYLFDATGGNSAETDYWDDPFSTSAEEAHERLNAVEDALSLCVGSLEDTNKGLIPTLERILGNVHVSLEDIDAVIADWNSLARKHNISPFSLPACHKALRSELDGNVEARTLLPNAIEEEKRALGEFERACHDLTVARQSVADALSRSVTQKLPDLGMDRAIFHVHLNGQVYQCTDLSVYGHGKRLGVDAVDFMLLHRQSGDESNPDVTEGRRRGGKLEVVGSAGEKARILLAIETALPGSVGVLCGTDARVQDTGDDTSRVDGTVQSIPSVAVIYDEIDAHVGGRAAVALAKLLVDQTRPRLQNGADEEGTTRGRGQVISITHSPSLAAVADRHVVIQKPVSAGDTATSANQMQNPVLVSLVDGTSRRKELGRMCGGDLAHEESLMFADALLRDGQLRREEQR